MKRYAIVRGARSRGEVEAYLPANYRVVHEAADDFYPAYPGGGVERRPPEQRVRLAFVVEGEDALGWTLDGYVAPRLASGLMVCEEIDLSHPIMKEVPA